MENNEFQFKTNINCGVSVAPVKTNLDKQRALAIGN